LAPVPHQPRAVVTVILPDRTASCEARSARVHPRGTSLFHRTVIKTCDGTYRLTRETVTTHASPTRTDTTDYWYDKAGNRTGMERDFGPAEELGLTTYQYGDPTSTSLIHGGPSNQVRVLRHWNSATPPAVDYSVQYRYSSWGCRSHRWVNPAGDAVSTMPGSGVDTFTWDREHRLVSSTIAAPAPPGVDRTAGAYTFRYDHRTRRLLRQSPSASALITYSGGLSVQEYDASSTGGGSSSGSSSGSGSPLVEYIRGSDYGGGIGGILYTIREGQASCQHYNSRGDVVAKSGADTTAAVTWAAAYLAFGTRPEEVGTNPDPQRANTKEEDGTGLLNEGHRYRCLETGMFISRDPAGFVDGPNLYAYVEQNPWTSFDPDGLNIEIRTNKQESDGNINIVHTIHVTGALLNTSDLADTEVSKREIELSLRTNFTKTVKIEDLNKIADTGYKSGTVTWKVEPELRIIKSEKEIKDQDHLFVIRNDNNSLGRAPIGGKYVSLPEDPFSTTKNMPSVDQPQGRNEELNKEKRRQISWYSCHEFGHSCGLRHSHSDDKIPDSPTDDKNTIRGLTKSNFMVYHGGLDSITRQFIHIHNEYEKGRLNQGDHKEALLPMREFLKLKGVDDGKP